MPASQLAFREQSSLQRCFASSRNAGMFPPSTDCSTDFSTLPPLPVTHCLMAWRELSDLTGCTGEREGSQQCSRYCSRCQYPPKNLGCNLGCQDKGSGLTTGRRRKDHGRRLQDPKHQAYIYYYPNVTQSGTPCHPPYITIPKASPTLRILKDRAPSKKPQSSSAAASGACQEERGPKQQEVIRISRRPDIHICFFRSLCFIQTALSKHNFLRANMMSRIM